MIPIAQVAEPADFNKKVRAPGNQFLRTMPNPTGQMWKSKNYWRNALGELIIAYGGVCAYCASWTKRATGLATPQDSSVDHFIPKGVAPTLAYEWDNYRLCRSRLNGRKDVHQDVIDPFTLEPGWFKLDFRTFFLVPNPKLPALDRARVLATIDRLQLNADNDYVNERIGAIREYCLGRANYGQLLKRYPFIATEIMDQNFDINFMPRMKPYFEAHP